jgi:cytoskeletal protein CcmA (bactofilin family)
MFSRTNKIESLVGEDAKFNGDLVIKGTIRVDGTVFGNVDVDWLILGENAFLQGNVSASGVVVGGKIQGNIEAKESVGIKSKGNVRGDIKTMKLTVDEGGILDGRIFMTTEAHAQTEVSNVSNESPKVVDFKNEKNKAEKVKGIKFEGIKFEEVKSS